MVAAESGLDRDVHIDDVRVTAATADHTNGPRHVEGHVRVANSVRTKKGGQARLANPATPDLGHDLRNDVDRRAETQGPIDQRSNPGIATLDRHQRSCIEAQTSVRHGTSGMKTDRAHASASGPGGPSSASISSSQSRRV